MITLDVFIDIDGTLLYFPGPEDDPEPRVGGQTLCPGAAAFVDYAARKHYAHWLSVWTAHGDDSAVRRRLGPFLPASATLIQAPDWGNVKTSVIDPARPWVWFDDDPYHTATAFAEAWFLARHANVIEVTGQSWQGVMEPGRGTFVHLAGDRHNMTVALRILRTLSGE
jgi:hypothetical protein